MSLYMIASFDIKDADGCEQYAQAAQPVLERYNGVLMLARHFSVSSF